MVKLQTEKLSSSLTTEGEWTDTSWLEWGNSEISTALSLPQQRASDIISNMNKEVEAAKAEAEKKGNPWNPRNWRPNPRNWFAGAGSQINGVKGALIETSQGPMGWILGGLASLGALGTAWALNQVGVSPQNIVQVGLNFSEVAYNFNINISDAELIKQIHALVDGLYGPAGEFIGRSCAQLLVGGLTTPPKVSVNIRGLALIYVMNEDIRDELLQGVSQFCYQSIFVVKQILFKIAFLQGRSAIKKLYASQPDAARALFPFGDKIESWGEEGSKPWSMQAAAEQRIEKIPDKKIQDFVKGLMEGFWDGFRESVEYVYT